MSIFNDSIYRILTSCLDFKNTHYIKIINMLQCYFFRNFFFLKASKKRLVKGSIFLKKKNKSKRCQYAREWYRILSEEEKNKKRQYGRETI